MELITGKDNSSVYVAAAPLWETGHSTQDARDHLLIGVSKSTLNRHQERGLSVHLGQLFGVVGPGLIFTEHLFQGLNRHMYVADDGNAAASKLAASWRQPRDAYAEGDWDDVRLAYRDPPADRVFVVYITPNTMLDAFPQVFGWAEHWTWVHADPDLEGAPVDWRNRFEHKLWSTPQP